MDDDNFRFGKVENKILNLLVEKGNMPVRSLYLLFYKGKHKPSSRDWRYNSVCRAVRNLEKKGYVVTYNTGIDELDPKYFRYGWFGTKPTYVKMVILDIKEKVP